MTSIRAKLTWIKKDVFSRVIGLYKNPLLQFEWFHTTYNCGPNTYYQSLIWQLAALGIFCSWICVHSQRVSSGGSPENNKTKSPIQRTFRVICNEVQQKKLTNWTQSNANEYWVTTNSVLSMTTNIPESGCVNRLLEVISFQLAR